MLKKIPYETSAEILSRFEATEEAAGVLDPAASPEALMDGLVEAGLIFDLANFIGHALPVRESIAWAIRSLELSGAEPHARAPEAIAAATRWVLEPQEARRQICMTLADEIGTEVAVGWLCLAVAWNGSGSIVPPGNPEVFPQPYLHAKAVFGAVALSAPPLDPERAAFIEAIRGAGVEIANGAWPIAREGA